MSIYPNLQLIRAGDNQVARDFQAREGRDLLVLFEENQAFVERVLSAAGYADIPHQVFLLQRQDKAPLDVSRLVRRLEVSKVLLFGQDLPSLGLHFQVAPYFPVVVAGLRFLVAQSVAEIATAKAEGDNAPAGNLWRALQKGFLHASK